MTHAATYEMAENLDVIARMFNVFDNSRGNGGPFRLGGKNLLDALRPAGVGLVAIEEVVLDRQIR